MDIGCRFHKKRKWGYILLMVCALGSGSLQAQTRRALVIGLGEQQDKSWAKINGDKDVPYVKEMLVESEYKDIVTLVNRQATKASIVSAFVAHKHRFCQVKTDKYAISDFIRLERW